MGRDTALLPADGAEGAQALTFWISPLQSCDRARFESNMKTVCWTAELPRGAWEASFSTHSIRELPGPPLHTAGTGDGPELDQQRELQP